MSLVNKAQKQSACRNGRDTEMETSVTKSLLQLTNTNNTRMYYYVTEMYGH